MRFTEIIGYTIAAVVAILIIAVGLRSCGDRAATPVKEQVDPDAVTHYVGGYYLHEVHPKPGVTCFVYTTYGVSCIKE